MHTVYMHTETAWKQLPKQLPNPGIRHGCFNELEKKWFIHICAHCRTSVLEDLHSFIIHQFTCSFQTVHIHISEKIQLGIKKVCNMAAQIVLYVSTVCVTFTTYLLVRFLPGAQGGSCNAPSTNCSLHNNSMD